MMRDGEIEAKGRAIGRAVRIIEEGLKAGLNMEAGGQLAANLRDLYGYVELQLTRANLRNDAAVIDECINLIGKIVNAATLWYGAHLVMEQQLTVGQFVAFNMFAQRVAQPIMRMAQMWTDFQQTGISMQRLGDILNTRTEVPPSAAAQLPALKAA